MPGESQVPVNDTNKVGREVSSIPVPLAEGAATRHRVGRLRLPSLGLRVSERKLLLCAVDLLIVNAALLFSLFIFEPYEQYSGRLFWFRVPFFFSLSALWVASGIVFDAYNVRIAADRSRSIGQCLGAAVMAELLFLVIPWLTPSLPKRRVEMFMQPVLAFCGLAAWRAVYCSLFAQPMFNQRLLIVGAGSAGNTLLQALQAGDRQPAASRDIGIEVIGFIDDDPLKQGMIMDSARVLGTRNEIERIVQETTPDEVVLAITNSSAIHEDLFERILDFRERGIRVSTMVEVFERLTGRVPVEHVGRNLHVVMPLTVSPAERVLQMGKRLSGIVAGCVGCVLVGLAIPFVWLGNLIWSPGPLFFRQMRVGKAGRTFEIIKFRSMVVEAEKDTGAVWAKENDPRITNVGRFLRKTRLDEFPQFVNVLLGQMNLVGPRPERPEFVEQLSREIPFYRIRHAVRPGLTGWAQVSYRYGASQEDALYKLQYDLYYLKHQSMMLDFEIIMKTLRVVLGLKGR